MVKIFFGIHRMIRLIHWTFARFLLENFWHMTSGGSDPGVIHKRKKDVFSLNSFFVCSLSYHPGATPLNLYLQRTAWDLGLGGWGEAGGGG